MHEINAPTLPNNSILQTIREEYLELFQTQTKCCADNGTNAGTFQDKE